MQVQEEIAKAVYTSDQSSLDALNLSNELSGAMNKTNKDMSDAAAKMAANSNDMAHLTSIANITVAVLIPVLSVGFGAYAGMSGGIDNAVRVGENVATGSQLAGQLGPVVPQILQAKDEADNGVEQGKLTEGQTAGSQVSETIKNSSKAGTRAQKIGQEISNEFADAVESQTQASTIDLKG